MNATIWLRRNCRFASTDPVIGPRIRPDATSQKIFATVLKVASANGLKTTFRVAGGWVRDNLLGIPSDDIDFSLDDMTGGHFAVYLANYADANPGSGISEAHTIKANPEKSKHLETVTVDIHGLKVDFVNLRVETYGESRIPTMEMGTPDTDARRRDLTINALFYNIQTGQVEDYMGGQGIKDLGLDTGKIVIRTPKDPDKDQLESTVRIFHDDPLRMLRALRFYSRYPNSVLDPAIVQAMSMPEVQERFLYVRGADDEPDKGVAPSRAGPELTKLFEGANPGNAIRVLFQTGFDKKVFNVPGYQNLMDMTMDQRNRHHAYNLLEHTIRVIENANKISTEAGLPKETRGLLNFSALFHDFGKASPGVGKPKENDPTQYGYEGHENFSADIAEEILRHIGKGEGDRQFVGTMVSMHMRPHRHANQGEADRDWTPKAMGRFIRETRPHGREDEAKDWWKYVMMLAQADVMSTGVGDMESELAERRRHMKQFEDLLASKPQSVAKPLLNGFQLMQMFPDIKPTKMVGGKNFIKYIQERLLDGQASGEITPENVNQKVEEIMSEIVNGSKTSIIDQFRKATNWVGDNCRLS